MCNYCAGCYEKYITHPNHANLHITYTNTQSHINAASTLELGRRGALPDTAVVAMVQSELSSILASRCLIGRDCKTAVWLVHKHINELIVHGMWTISTHNDVSQWVIMLTNFRNRLDKIYWVGLLNLCNMILVKQITLWTDCWIQIIKSIQALCGLIFSIKILIM